MSKNKNKPMSKNQKVEYMHNVTGLSYKKCRSLLKANDWDLFKAMGFDDILEKISNLAKSIGEILRPAIEAMYESCKRMAKDIAKVLSEIDWKEIAEEAKKMKEAEIQDLNDEESIDTGGINHDGI